MIRKLLIVCALFLLTASASAQAPDGTEAAASDPVVIGTAPQAGATGVDPSLSRISVTFSKDMMTKNQWSWVMESRETFPAVTESPQFIDSRTCILPVKLEPGKTYRVWINSEKHTGFRDDDNRPSVPYLLSFQTK